MKKISLIIALCFIRLISLAQNSGPIITGAPGLTIAPDARSAAMGDLGVATSPDESSNYWNPAKLAMLQNQFGVGLNYTSWLSGKAKNTAQIYLSGFKKINDEIAVGMSLNYSSLGIVAIRDEMGTDAGQLKPNEFGLDITFAQKLSDNFSMGYTLRYIRSDFGNTDIGGVIKPADALAADVGMYYNLEIGKDRIAVGASMANVGTKLNYGTGKKMFLPTNLRLGANYSIVNENRINIGLEFNKLLVPSTDPLTYEEPKSVVSGIFSSFGDAPGGFKEELKEISTSLGLEYILNDSFAFRTGFRMQDPSKSNFQFISFGGGYVNERMKIDFSYLIGTRKLNPISNTFRVSLIYSVE